MIKDKHPYSKLQFIWLFVLRIVIGWYFLYEGIAKVVSSNWTSYGYLMDSGGVFAPLFKSLAQNPDLMRIVDILNIYGLMIIGVLLIFGLFEKLAYIGAIALLALYYLSHPASLNAVYALPPEGSYLWINKNVVMMCSIIVLMVFPTANYLGLDRLFLLYRNKNEVDGNEIR